MNILLGLIGIGASYGMIRYRDKVVGFTGPWGWAESWLGAGRSYTACMLVGVIVFFVSITIMTGLMDDLLGGTLGRFFAPPRPVR